MEQTNMMMPNGMPANMKGSIQRPQPGNVMQQMHAKIMTDLHNTMNQVGTGWQLTCNLNERSNYLIQLVTQLRSMQPDTAKCLGIAQNFELKLIQSSPTKEVYVQQIRQKLIEITQKRREQAASQMLNGPMGPGPGMNPNNMNMPNNGMNMDGNLAIQNGQMNQNGPQQNAPFPAHLQRPMQPSPIPPAQQPATMDPSALQAPQMAQQMSGMGQNMSQQNSNPGQGPPGAAMQLGQQQIEVAATQFFNNMPDAQKQGIRQRYIGSLSQEQLAQESANGADPLMTLLRRKARENILKSRAGNQGNQGMPQNGVPQNNGQNLQGNTLQQQSTASQSGGPNFDVTGMLNQQTTARKLQESGEQVVPASNNVNFAMGGQMNMGQGINPQVLQGNQQGNDQQMNPQIQQILREQQRQQQMQRQNIMAQQQAMAQRQQANQLRGQPGGLHAPNALNGGPAGQMHSPAMTLLNQPMVPPGQAAPGTPQPNRPQGQPQTPMNAANQQLMQHHQQMLNQNNQQMLNQNNQQMLNQNNQQMPSGNQGPAAQQRMQIIQQMQQVPQQLRQGLWEKLQNMPPQQASAILNRIKGLGQENQMNGQNNQNGMPQNANTDGTQPGGQMFLGMPQGMGNAGPGINAQQTPNTQMENLQMQQRLHQQNQRQAHIRQQAMDARTFPAMIPKTYGMSVPQEVKTWGALKRHIAQNQAVIPPQTLEKVQSTQNQWFELHPEELEQAMHALRQAMTGQQTQPQPPTTGAPNNMPMPNGQAPPAQMVPPTAPMQPGQNAGPNMNPGQQRQLPNNGQPSQQEIQIIRQRNPQQFANVSDDQIRHFLWKRRMDSAAAKAGGNPQLQQQQAALRAAQARQTQAATAGQTAGGVPNGNQQTSIRPPPAQPNGQQMNGQIQGQKRPQASNDDVMEIPNPNAPNAITQQSAAMQPTQPQQQTPRLSGMPTKEQLQNMPAHERTAIMAARQKQIDALRKAQQGLGNNQSGGASQSQPQPNLNEITSGAQAATVQPVARARAMYEEVVKANPKGPPVQIDDEALNQAKAALKKLWQPAVRMHTTWATALATPGFSEAKVRGAMKARILVLQNVTDQDGTINEYLSLNAAQLREASFAFNQYFTDMKQIRDMQATKAGQAPQAPGQPSGQRTPSAMPKPQQPQQAPGMGKAAPQQGHGRKASQNSKAPPAPTDNKPFDWGAPSPHGVPKYEFQRSELTPDKLKFPPTKKRRTGGQPDSQGSTPAGQTGTPGAMANTSPNVTSAKAPSPEQVRRSQQQVKQEAEAREADRKRFKCSDDFCDGNLRGFETEDELRKHNESVHPHVDDPLQFLLENAAESLGLDMEGQPKPKDKVLNAAKVKVQKATPAPKAPFKRDAATPNVKQESATPTSGPQAKAKPKAMPTSVPPQDTPAKPEQTMKGLLEEKMGFTLPEQEATPVPEASANDFDSDWTDMIQHNLGGISGLDDWSLFDHPHIDIGLPPHASDSSPSLTPSDASTQSRESDVSQSERLRINLEWDPFGNGDTLVPEHLRKMKTLDLDDAFGGVPEKIGDDVAMVDADKVAGKEGEGKDPWNWSGDLPDWIYGDDAGLTEEDEFNLVLE